MLTEVALPLVALAVAGWILPCALGRALPEGVGWLAVNAVLSTVLLLGLAAVGFVWLYGPASGMVWRQAPGYFLVQGARSALVWGPVMVLSLANLPRGWKRATW